MTISKKVGVFLATLIISIVALEAGERLAIPGVHGLVSTTEARVGRPLTPVSVAGAARRTTRRCAAGVYNC